MKEALYNLYFLYSYDFMYVSRSKKAKMPLIEVLPDVSVVSDTENTSSDSLSATPKEEDQLAATHQPDARPAKVISSHCIASPVKISSSLSATSPSKVTQKSGSRSGHRKSGSRHTSRKGGEKVSTEL